MTGVLIHFSNSCKKLQSVFQWEWVDDDKQCKYEKRNWNPFSKAMRKRNTKNEIQIRFSKWWENEKQKPKFKSPFQSAAKTKNEKRNSNPFFNVTSRQKTKNRNGNGIPFYKAEEKRKIKRKFKFHFFMPSKNGWHQGTRIHLDQYYLFSDFGKEMKYSLSY